jgi:hypothetical protein
MSPPKTNKSSMFGKDEQPRDSVHRRLSATQKWRMLNLGVKNIIMSTSCCDMASSSTTYSMSLMIDQYV